jgi:SAM-dependent methyltransferase/uncharacterized protein YbaR (Trm112 family)
VNNKIDSWLVDNLICPRHQSSLEHRYEGLVCSHGCKFPIVENVPVMLLAEERQTIESCNTSLRLARQGPGEMGLYTESIGLNEHERQGILDLARKGTKIDPAVAFLIGATNGIAYKHLIGTLDCYPIPELRLPTGNGQRLLDIGCNWGRWSIAAARKGYRPVGIDPSLGAVMAARRVARQLGVEATFVVGDARFLPFKSGTFEQVFSYSVIQHFSREDAERTIAQIGRVLKEGGASLVQMPMKVGVRCLYHQARRKFREGMGFEVRYWSIPTLRSIFDSNVGTTSFSVDCFFGIGLQRSDLDLMPPMLRAAIIASETLRALSRAFPPLVWLADSVYVSSVKKSKLTAL